MFKKLVQTEVLANSYRERMMNYTNRKPQNNFFSETSKEKITNFLAEDHPLNNQEKIRNQQVVSSYDRIQRSLLLSPKEKWLIAEKRRMKEMAYEEMQAKTQMKSTNVSQNLKVMSSRGAGTRAEGNKCFSSELNNQSAFTMSPRTNTTTKADNFSFVKQNCHPLNKSRVELVDDQKRQRMKVKYQKIRNMHQQVIKHKEQAAAIAASTPKAVQLPQLQKKVGSI